MSTASTYTVRERFTEDNLLDVFRTSLQKHPGKIGPIHLERNVCPWDVHENCDCSERGYLTFTVEAKPKPNPMFDAQAFSSYGIALESRDPIARIAKILNDLRRAGRFVVSHQTTEVTLCGNQVLILTVESRKDTPARLATCWHGTPHLAAL